MPVPPEYVVKALKEGWAKTQNIYIEYEYPPGEVSFLSQPRLENSVLLGYAWSYGQMVNSNDVQHYSSDFRFVHKQPGIKKMVDYMTKSTMGYVYPVFFVLTRDKPLQIIAKNDTGDFQTIDNLIFNIHFKSKEAYKKWSDWFNEYYETSVSAVEEKGPEAIK